MDLPYEPIPEVSNTGNICRVFFVGEPVTPTIKANNDAKYGEGIRISLTCQSSSTTFPEYYRELLPWSYTWYRNGSEVYHGSTYSFIISRVNMHDEIVCRAKEVTASIKSKFYKIRLVKCK